MSALSFHCPFASIASRLIADKGSRTSEMIAGKIYEQFLRARVIIVQRFAFHIRRTVAKLLLVGA